MAETGADGDAGERAATPEVVAVGSAVVDRTFVCSNLPEPDGGAFVRAEYENFGGVAANEACALATLGREVGIVSRVGDDAAGDRIRADLDDWGLDTRRVRRGTDERSTYSHVLRDPDGERMVITGGESARNLRLDDADRAYLRGAEALVANAYVPDPVVRDLLELDPPLAFDLTGPLAELEGRGTRPETLDRLLDEAALFVASEVPVRSFLGCGPREAAERLRDRGVARAALTRGADGALLVADGAVHEVPAFDVETVDATGAGDAFAAALVHAWVLQGRSAREAGRFAAAAAALNCTAEGARGNLATATAAKRLAGDRE